MQEATVDWGDHQLIQCQSLSPTLTLLTINNGCLPCDVEVIHISFIAGYILNEEATGF